MTNITKDGWRLLHRDTGHPAKMGHNGTLKTGQTYVFVGGAPPLNSGRGRIWVRPTNGQGRSMRPLETISFYPDAFGLEWFPEGDA